MLDYKKSFGALLGNTMQFYDFTLYAFLAPQIKQTFFDFDNTYLSYLVVFGVFACGYLTRPIGALLFRFGISLFGSYQDVFVSSSLAFSAGVFLCISLSDLLPEMEFHAHNRVRLTAALLAGILLAYGITFLEPGHLH